MNNVLLIQTFEESPIGLSPLEKAMSQFLGSRLFAIDNFSDKNSTHWALKWLESESSVEIVLWHHGFTKVDKIQPFLNFMIKFPNKCRLFTNSNHPLVQKISKLVPIQKIENEKALLEIFKPA